jgi:FixJ family two-component response regulator
LKTEKSDRKFGFPRKVNYRVKNQGFRFAKNQIIGKTIFSRQMARTLAHHGPLASPIEENMAKSKFRICFVDGDPSAYEPLRVAAKVAGFESVTFANAREFLAGFDPSNIGCIVLEMRLPGMSGLELQGILKAQKTPVPLMFLTGHADIPLTVQAMKNGAQDVLEKPFKMTVVLDRIKQMLALNATWRKTEKERRDIAERMALLTRRELEVMGLMADGLKNKHIAKRLGISMKTLDIHRTKVMLKMKSRTWADIARWRYLHESGPGGKIVLKPGYVP